MSINRNNTIFNSLLSNVQDVLFIYDSPKSLYKIMFFKKNMIIVFLNKIILISYSDISKFIEYENFYRIKYSSFDIKINKKEINTDFNIYLKSLSENYLSLSQESNILDFIHFTKSDNLKNINDYVLCSNFISTEKANDFFKFNRVKIIYYIILLLLDFPLLCLFFFSIIFPFHYYSVNDNSILFDVALCLFAIVVGFAVSLNTIITKFQKKYNSSAPNHISTLFIDDKVILFFQNEILLFKKKRLIYVGSKGKVHYYGVKLGSYSSFGFFPLFPLIVSDDNFLKTTKILRKKSS